MRVLVLLSVLLQPQGGATCPISCYNDNGSAVDWFYVYKLPRVAHGPPEDPEEGLRYLLLERDRKVWAKGNVSINDTQGAIGKTLERLYSQSSDMAYILYNDQSPGQRSRGLGRYPGHTKGVVLVDRTQGFWLVHSTPNFPPPQSAGHFSYPESGRINGQNFLCVTYPMERFHAIGEQLHINQPHVFDCHVPEDLASLVPALSALCHKPRPSVPPSLSNRSMILTSAAGTQFTSFAKGAAFNNDLYHSWVAPSLGTALLVQFWVRSTGVLPSDCSGGWKVLNIQQLSPAGGPRFNTSLDHSKWAASPEDVQEGGGWVCVGDVNRNHAEEQRGGGTVCQRDPQVWKAYRRAAVQCQDCGGGVTTC